MLRWRLILGTLLVAALIALGWLDACAATPGAWLVPVAVVVVVLATGEALALARAAGLRPAGGPVYAVNLLLLAAAWRGGSGVSMACVLALGLVAAFCVEMRRYERPGGVTGNLAAAVLAMLYVGLLCAMLVQLRRAWGVGALASLLLVVKIGDIAAYAVGRLCGRHKLSPLLSPGKTIEGAVGAIAFGCLASWASFAWFVPALTPDGVPPGLPLGWLVYGLLVGAAGMVGDLAESLLKRDAAQKDSSRWLPGFGGVLDMIDSILLAVPVAWLCWALGLVGR